MARAAAARCEGAKGGEEAEDAAERADGAVCGGGLALLALAVVSALDGWPLEALAGCAVALLMTESSRRGAASRVGRSVRDGWMTLPPPVLANTAPL